MEGKGMYRWQKIFLLIVSWMNLCKSLNLSELHYSHLQSGKNKVALAEGVYIYIYISRTFENRKVLCTRQDSIRLRESWKIFRENKNNDKMMGARVGSPEFGPALPPRATVSF